MHETPVTRTVNLAMALPLFATLMLISSCSRRPSDTTIVQAIADTVKYRLPDTVQDDGSVVRAGPTDEMFSIKIMQVGKFNDEYRYWPVKGEIAGSFLYSSSGSITVPTLYDRVVTFHLYQDDSQNWKARVIEVLPVGQWMREERTHE